MCWVPLRSTQPTGDSDRTWNSLETIGELEQNLNVNSLQYNFLNAGYSQDKISRLKSSFRAIQPTSAGDNTITRGISANLIVGFDSSFREISSFSPQTVLEGNLGYSSPVKESVPKVTLFDDQSVKTSIGEVGITEVTFGKGSFNSDTAHRGIGEINFGSVTIHESGINQVSSSKVGIVKHRVLYPSSLQIGFSQISSVEEAMRKISADRLNGSHYSIDKFAHSKIGTSQVGMAEDRFSQIQLNELAKSQISSAQVSSLPIRFMSFQPSQIGSSQIGSSQSNIVHPSFEQDCCTQIGIGQVNRAKHNLSEIGSTEIDTSQINTSAIDRDTIEINPTQVNPTKVSFPSSISLQQFFTSHANTFLLTNIYSTAQTLWQTATPINLNFEVTNLPTGQLAEAVITSYDSLGRPNGGTILIDNDADGSINPSTLTIQTNARNGAIAIKGDGTANYENFKEDFHR